MVGSRLVVLAALAGLVPLAGCAAPAPSSPDVAVTSQPLADAFERLDARSRVAAIPDWTIVDEPWDAERVGRPFAIEAEALVRLEPGLVLDQPHPLVSGPSREAMRTGVEQAGIEHRTVPTEPRLSTVEATLEAAGEAVGEDPRPAWQRLREDLARVNETLAGRDEPATLFVFPAGLVAGSGTDVHRVLELAGMRNAAAEAGLEGYAQITDEAVRRADLDLVIATATTHATPEEVAGRPMFEGTRVEDAPERVLVVDPSRTTRLGPHLARAVERLAAWAHPGLPGPRVSPALDPYEVEACERVEVSPGAPNATVELLGETREPGAIEVPDVPEGHYRVTVRARDATGTAAMATTLTVEGSACA